MSYAECVPSAESFRFQLCVYVAAISTCVRSAVATRIGQKQDPIVTSYEEHANEGSQPTKQKPAIAAARANYGRVRYD